MKKNILITGGSGYIGQILAFNLIKKFNIIIIDKVKPNKIINKKVKFYKTDFSNKKYINKIFDKYDILVVIHLAAFIDAKESTIKKSKYLDNNYLKFLKFLNIIEKRKIQKVIFASSAAVYGNSKKTNSETLNAKPINWYGKSKLLSEIALSKSKIKNKIILRFFNVVGANKKNNLGQTSKNSKSLFRIISNKIITNKVLCIYGINHNTKDGTTIRDYIHVEDIVKIIIEMIKIKKSISFKIFNCGYEKGYSIYQIIEAFKKITNKKVKIKVKKKVQGDISNSVAKCNNLNKFIDFKPKYSQIGKMVKSAYKWEKKLFSNKILKV